MTTALNRRMTLFHHFQPVPHRLGAVPPSPAWTVNCLDDLAVLDDSTRFRLLADDGAGIAAHERVTPNVLAALDRFEQERFALAANFAIGGERRFQIGQKPARDRDQVALAGQFQKFSFALDNSSASTP